MIKEIKIMKKIIILSLVLTFLTGITAYASSPGQAEAEYSGWEQLDWVADKTIEVTAVSGKPGTELEAMLEGNGVPESVRCAVVLAGCDKGESITVCEGTDRYVFECLDSQYSQEWKDHRFTAYSVNKFRIYRIQSEKPLGALKNMGLMPELDLTDLFRDAFSTTIQSESRATTIKVSMDGTVDEKCRRDYRK